MLDYPWTQEEVIVSVIFLVLATSPLWALLLVL